MTPERWQRVKGVLENALELLPSERVAFLNQACDGDQELREEVESLLAAGDEARASLLQSTPVMRLGKGTRVGDYEIQSFLGAGGMGEVYRARDLQLRREVAIKVLPAFVSSNPDRLRRFEQEATAAAALNHPNILAVYQMGTHQGAPYLVSELLEGETLGEQIKRGRMAVRRAIDYAVQIARGLAAAHEKGIVHRDLKPENLFVTKDGRMKILDFGLAKLMQPQPGSEHSAPRLTERTEPGVVMGTVGYMAPEQVRGQRADHRADIFAFGAILYEMLSGKRAFQKPTSPETMTSILNEDPPGISQVVPNLPPALQRVVHRCLEKNPEQRFQSASDLAFAVEALSDSGGSAQSATTAKGATGTGNRWKMMIPAAIVLVALSVGGWLYLHRRPTLAEKDTIVLADFANSSGDAVFDDTLKTALSVSLQQSPFLNVLSDGQVAQTLQLMTRPASTKLTPDVARELCLRVGSKVYIAGSIGSLGSEYVLGLKAVNCQNGDTLAQKQITAESKEKVLDALDQAAVDLRGRLGESLNSIQKFDTPVEQATTSSLEALKAYSSGRRIQSQGGELQAIPFYKRAIDLDPSFASSHASLGLTYGNAYQSSLARVELQRAFELRDRVSEREKFHIAALYYAFVTGEIEKEIETYQLWAQSYPRDFIPHNNLSNNYLDLGQNEKAIAEARESLHLLPNAPPYGGLAYGYLALNRFEEAKAITEEALARNFDSGLQRRVLYSLAFLRGDAAAMQQQLAWANSGPAVGVFLLGSQSRSEAYFGRLARSNESFRHAVEQAQRVHLQELASYWQIQSALLEAEFGNPHRVRTAVAGAMALTPDSLNTRELAALALARAGETERASALANELEQQFPSNTLLKVYFLPTVRGALELNRNHPDHAVEILQTVIPYELQGSDASWYLYSAYIRGLAFLRLDQGTAAAAEFQKLLDHSGVVVNYPTGALAHLQLGRAHAMSGDPAEARAAYQDFLTLWKDADPNIPILAEAKAEYAKLQRDHLSGQVARPHIESLAVLPLENFSKDPSQDYFADGMTEVLIADLSQIGKLRVTSRTSVMRFKQAKKPLPEIARELNVDAVVEGSVLSSGGRVRITAQLIYAPTDRHLWAKSYERDLGDVLLLQSEVARTIADEIKVTLTPQEELQLGGARRVNPEANDAFLRGRYYWGKRTPDDLKRAFEYFKLALEKDPRYAPAYSGIAEYYSVLPFYTRSTPDEVFPKAKAAVSKALELDDTLAEAHGTDAYIKAYYDWDWAGAEEEFKRSLALDPNNATVHHRYSRFLASLGRIDEALSEVKRARELDPLSLVAKANVGVIYYFGRRYDQAIDELKRLLETQPDFSVAHWGLGLAYEQKRMYQQAIEEFEKAAALEKDDPNSIASLGHAYAVTGNKAAALKTLDELNTLAKQSDVSPYQLALVYAGLGEKEHAFDSLEKAKLGRSTLLTYLKMDPRFDSLRSDPRFQDLLRRMGLSL